jgi:thiamine-monophosphate kinase
MAPGLCSDVCDLPEGKRWCVLQTNELQLIKQIKEWTGSRFIGDDCAVLPGGTLVSSDSLVEGTHFCLDWTSLEALGWKSCAVNLSDIAAMAGRATYLTVSLTVSKSMDERAFKQFYTGFAKCASSYRAQIVGGDLTSGPVLVIAVTAMGQVHENGCLRRSGAKPGDVVVATGDFGASAAGLWILQQGSARPDLRRFDYCLERHTRPLPRLCESWALVRKTAERGALMDTSDGLADAATQIARASGVAIELDLESLHVHPQTREVAALAKVDVSEWVLYGGEDYELVATMDAQTWHSWSDKDSHPSVSSNPFHKIGTVTTGNDVTVKLPGRGKQAIDLSKCFQQIGQT